MVGLAVFGLWLGFIILKVFFNVNDSVNPPCCFMRTHMRKRKVMYRYVNVGRVDKSCLHERLVRSVLNSNWLKGMNEGFRLEADITEEMLQRL